MQTSWNGDKTILQSINNTIATILQNTNVSMNSDVYNTTEIQNIKNSITGISTNVQAIEGRDRYYYMLVKPTVQGGSSYFKDYPTIAKITNDDENVEIGIFPCSYNFSAPGVNYYAFVDGVLEDDVAQIFAMHKNSTIANSSNSHLCVKNMLDIDITSIHYNDSHYDVYSYNRNDSPAYGDNLLEIIHDHIIQNTVKNDFSIAISDDSNIYCTSKYFKTLRLKALYHGSYMIVVKTKGSINYVDDVTMNSVISTLDGTPNFQEDTTNSANFKHYNYNNGNKSTNIYLQENAIVIPPTLI